MQSSQFRHRATKRRGAHRLGRPPVVTRPSTRRGAVLGALVACVSVLTGIMATSSPASSPSLLARTDLIYGSEIGAWQTDGGPAADESSGVPQRVRSAGMSVVRFAAYDCFTDMTCGSDNHRGTISRSSFTNAVVNGVMGNNAVLWLKMVPVAKDTIGTVNGAVFCPPWTGDASGNLSMYKAVVAQARAAGYSGPLIIESNNEMEYSCWREWQKQGAPISSAGSVGVSKRLGEHFAQTMPALKAYARSLGFSEVVTGGYLGISGGPGWGQTCTADTTKPYGYACGYQPRWVAEFSTAVHNAYLANGSNPDYIPDFLSMHAYPHGPDFSSAAGYEFDDNIAYAYFRNWLIRSRHVVDSVWGTTIGSGVRFSISEWNAGVSRSDSWSGWSTPGRPEQFYAGWFDMLRGDGVTTGAGTRYWNANAFLIAGNSDTGSGRSYNIIRRDGSVPPWYYTFRNAALGEAVAPQPYSRTALSVNDKTASYGQRLRFRVRSTLQYPSGYYANKYATVALQKKTSSGWVRIGAGYTNIYGVAVIRVTWKHRAMRAVRAVTPVTDDYRRSYSATIWIR